jgi:hypothetical protein
VHLEGVSGELINVTEGFVEESPPNLNVSFAAAVPITCGTTKLAGAFMAKFFLETMSTTTDTAFIGP